MKLTKCCDHLSANELETLGQLLGVVRSRLKHTGFEIIWKRI